MSKLKEARELLKTSGIGARSYRSATGCYCSIGALHKAYSGNPDGCTTDLYDAGFSHDSDAVKDRIREFSEDLSRLHKAIYGTRTSTFSLAQAWRAKADIEDWNDGVFCQTLITLLAEHRPDFDPVEVTRVASEKVLAVWDNAIEELNE